MTTTFAERVVSRLTTRGESRRGFLAKAALAGSALAVNPWSYLTRPASAYDVVCGAQNECGDGWTVFCCTINNGANQCPPGSFIAGWWKADNSGFCCGTARYYIDCNETCGTTDTNYTCHCNSTTCDRRRVACNQFRYGQCNTHISCYGPVVCRLVTCTPPWQMEGFNCSSSAATDNRTATHSAPCLPGNCPSAITRLYYDLGGPGASTLLGKVTRAEGAHPAGGTYAVYERGAIFSLSGTGTYAVTGPIWTRYNQMGHASSPLGHPTNTTKPVGDRRGRYSRFRNGAIFWSSTTGAHEVHGSFFIRYQGHGGVTGSMGYPVSNETATGDNRGSFIRFEGGNIYAEKAAGTFTVRGSLRAKYEAVGGPRGGLGYPRSNTMPIGTDGAGRYNSFERGLILTRPGVPVTTLMTGPIRSKWESLGGVTSRLGYPTSDSFAWEGLRRQNFQGGYITHNAATNEVVVTYNIT